MTKRKYLLGPVREVNGEAPCFIAISGTKTTLHTEVVSREDAADLELSRTHARFELGAEIFKDERSLLQRALQLWPNDQTKKVVADFEKLAEMAAAMNAAGVTPSKTCH